MPRLSLKPDSSFFRKIAIGAVGTRAIAADLAQYGHLMRELERGSLDTKIWKEVKRKRVRIPDLLCSNCGLRVESRAKTEPKLSMSHSDEEVRAWDFGMVDSDAVAFPVCRSSLESYWSTGRLSLDTSYWHERNWVRWNSREFINYVLTSEFRHAPFRKEKAKGVTEGSESTISWPAVFSKVDGVIDAIEDHRIVIRPDTGSKRWLRLNAHVAPVVHVGEKVFSNQLLASNVKPVRPIQCPGQLSADHISSLLASRERTQRFTGVKLARLRGEEQYEAVIADLEADAEEDVYIRLEAAAYLAGVSGREPRVLFAPYLTSTDEQQKLEAVIALGETRTTEAVAVLSEILADTTQPYFMRSGAAWCIGQAGGAHAAEQLVATFGDVDQSIREEALEALAYVGGDATAVLMAGLSDVRDEIAVGCAEALRRRDLPQEAIVEAAGLIRSNDPPKWAVWLLGNLPKETVAPFIAEVQNENPRLHFALTLLWAFTESWVARRWEALPNAVYPNE